jgi:hypothetical protein
LQSKKLHWKGKLAADIIQSKEFQNFLLLAILSLGLVLKLYENSEVKSRQVAKEIV